MIRFIFTGLVSVALVAAFVSESSAAAHAVEEVVVAVAASAE